MTLFCFVWTIPDDRNDVDYIICFYSNVLLDMVRNQKFNWFLNGSGSKDIVDIPEYINHSTYDSEYMSLMPSFRFEC